MQRWNKFGDITYKAWYFHGQMHGTDGPAESVWEDYNGEDVDADDYEPGEVSLVYERWYLHGQQHLTDGPTELKWCGSGHDNLTGQKWFV